MRPREAGEPRRMLGPIARPSSFEARDLRSLAPQDDGVTRTCVIAPIFGDAGASSFASLPFGRTEGDGAPDSASSWIAALRRRALLRSRARAGRRSIAAFNQSPGRAFGSDLGVKLLFLKQRPAGRSPSAGSLQGPIVVPSGAPAPPGCGVTSPARRRRIRSRHRNVSRRRPSERTGRCGL